MHGVSAISSSELSSLCLRSQLTSFNSAVRSCSPGRSHVKMRRRVSETITVTRQNIEAPHGGLTFSPAVKAGDFVIVSGRIPGDEKDGLPILSVKKQTNAANVQMT